MMKMTTGSPFLLGVNYWPRRKAMGWWSAFDSAETRDEFALIQSLGLNVVRLFLLWEDWQPSAEMVNLNALRQLEKVCEHALDHQLQLDVTFFTGHMSGPNWVPSWLLQRQTPMPAHVRQVISQGKAVNCGYLHPYEHPIALKAQQLLLKEVVGALHQHPAIGCWNLGNEPDLLAWPTSAEAGRDWVRRMTQTIKEIDPTHPVTCGLHADSLIKNNGFRVHDVFGEVDFAVMHGYPMYADQWAKYPLDPDFVPYLCALTSALSDGKPTLMEEFGGCTAPYGQATTTWEWSAFGTPRKQLMASEESFAEHIDQVLPNLVKAGATGAVLWCFADYDKSLWDRPPCDDKGNKHERHFGLIRPDGSLKLHAEVIRQFAQTRPMIAPPKRTLTLDISAEEYYKRPAFHAHRLYDHF